MTNRGVISLTNQLILLVFYLPFLPTIQLYYISKSNIFKEAMMVLCGWTTHVYGNTITLTYCHTTMEFWLSWFIANPTQQLHYRCSHICICNCFLPALSGLPYFRICSCL